MKFADQLKARTEEAQKQAILAKLALAQQRAQEQLNEIDVQKQRVLDVINQAKLACLAAADNGEHNFVLDITPFLSRKLSIVEDPVYCALHDFFKTEGLNYTLPWTRPSAPEDLKQGCSAGDPKKQWLNILFYITW